MKRRFTDSFPDVIAAGMTTVLVLAILLTGSPSVSHAAGVEVLPQQQPQTLAPAPPPLSSQQERTLPQRTIPHTSSQQEETIPRKTIPPHLPMGLGSNTREIPLPQVFRGCWSGSVPAVDSIQPLQAGEPPIIWLTKLLYLVLSPDRSQRQVAADLCRQLGRGY